MKKIMLFLIFVNFVFAIRSNAQWIYNTATSTGTVTPTYLENNGSAPIIFGTGSTDRMTLTTSGDLNILAAARGYQINGNYVLWHNGNITNIFVGVGTGNGAPSVIQNTFVGGSAGSANQADYNTAMGYEALTNNTYATYNTALGMFALYSQAYSNSNTLYNTSNTAVGIYALYSNQPTSNTNGYVNTAIGASAMQDNTTGSGNTAAGTYSLYNNIMGNSNTALGHQAIDNNTNGSFNTAIGDNALGNGSTGTHNTATGCQALYYNTDSFNVADGMYALLDNTTGSYNSGTGALSQFLNQSGSYNASDGVNALYTNMSGSYNTCMGGDADVATGALNFATAIGATAIAAADHQMELGENNATITLGMSAHVPTASPVTRLEINTAYGSSPFTMTYNIASPVVPSPATGWSGLRFDDLTDASIPGKNPGPGYLALNAQGDVIYVDTALSTGGTGIGTCTSPTTLTSANGAIDMANVANFYFLGNNHGTGVNNVAIGIPCTSNLTAKLSVLQASGTTNSISTGLNVENDDDYVFGVACPISATSPNVIGIRSYIPGNSTYPRTSKVAGWFEADVSPSCCSTTGSGPQYAIYVPQNGGSVALGYVWNSSMTGNPYQTCPSGFELDVNGSAFLTSGTLWTTSDSSIKTDVSSIKNPLDIIKKLNGISYQYIPSALSDSGSVGTHYGFIAQQVARVIPNVVKTNRATGKEGIAYTEIIPWLVEGMKQQQQTIDSLRTMLQTIQNTLSNSGGNSTGAVLNSQDVSLSGSTSTPLLYQNAPNPFSTGTKINYYLPEGTTGATIVFYDTYGNLIKTIQLNQTGNGTLSITPDNLSNGIYSYSLIVGGSVIDTKRMLLQK